LESLKIFFLKEKGVTGEKGFLKKGSNAQYYVFNNLKTTLIMKLIKRVEGSVVEKQIIIRNQAGEDVVFKEYAVNAMELENKFKLVRIHLEGSDNCVKFPDKSTGEFHDLKSEVLYTIWGIRFSIIDLN
jgi:hypothetical protein